MKNIKTTKYEIKTRAGSKETRKKDEHVRENEKTINRIPLQIGNKAGEITIDQKVLTKSI